MRKYELPSFLSKRVSHEVYEHWLRRRAQSHVKRDRRRGNKEAIGELYRIAIHEAVLKSDGCDAYTGEELNWRLISQFNNYEAQEHGRHYKRKFALLPTVDHVGDGKGRPDFKICALRTNDAKNDLALFEFVSICRAVLEHLGYVVKQGGKRIRLRSGPTGPAASRG